MSALTTRAPGKVNLCLFLGPTRADGLHELVSVIQPLELADELTLEPAEADEVVCPGVEGENLAWRALEAYRRAGGLEGRWRLVIDKRVPVAGGMGGGSSDAAGVLRLAARAAGRGDDPLPARLAPGLGADVPALLEAAPALVTGAGEEVRRLDAGVAPWSYVVLPLPHRLATPDVYAEADRLGLARSHEELAERRRRVDDSIASGVLSLELVHNDLQAAARSLCPAIDGALAALDATGAARSLVSGSGPTVVGLFDGAEAAATAASAIPGARAMEAFAQ